MKKFLRYSLYSIICVVLFIIATDQWVSHNAKTTQYTSVSEIPYNKVGLLLGTSKYISNGNDNWFYKHRINAAVALFKAGKIDYIIVSGDNRHHSYDEPSMMKKDLIDNGIPASRIVPDYAGFRTLDSVVRCKEVFGQESVTIISQAFHNERALFIAENRNMKAIAFNAKDVRSDSRAGMKVLLREKLARVKMLLDLCFGKEPKFLGEPIIIP